MVFLMRALSERRVESTWHILLIHHTAVHSHTSHLRASTAVVVVVVVVVVIITRAAETISLTAVAVAGAAGMISSVDVSFEETLNGCIECCSWSAFE